LPPVPAVPVGVTSGARREDPLYGLGGHAYTLPAANLGSIQPVMAALQHRWLVVAVVALLGAGLGLMAGLAMPPRFAATTSVVLGAPRPQFAELEDMISGLPLSKDTMANEIELLQSRKLAKAVIADLQLDRLAELNPALAEAGGLRVTLDKAKAEARRWLRDAAARLGLAYGSADVAEAAATRDGIEDVVDAFLAQLEVTIRGPSQVLDVTFYSKEPELAAVVANSLARHYLIDRAAVRAAAATTASDWFQKRLTELQANFERREAAVESFREQTGLLKGARAPLRAEQISHLSEQLLDARNLLTQAQARYQEALAAQTSQGQGVSDVLSSVTIQDLRREEGLLQAEMAELSQRLGPRHPQMIDRRQRLARLRAEIASEVERIVRSLRAEAAIQAQRVQELEAALQRLEQRMHDEGVAEGRLRVLEREAEAARTLYEEALKRVETSAPAGQVEASDGRVISEAVVSLAPATPSPAVLAALGLLFGCFIGSAAAFGLELRDRRFRNTHQAEQRMHLPVVGVVPAIASFRGGKRQQWPEDQIVTNPGGPFAEVIRTIRNRLLLSLPEGRPERIVVTSSVKSEGKTTLAIALARSLAKSGREVLLIDGDLRLGRVDSVLGQKGLPGLSDYLLGRVGLADIITRDRLSELRFIPCGARSASIGDLLQSRRLAGLFDFLDAQFDLVIVDTPPILPVADTTNFIRFAELAILVVDWAQMRPDIVDAGAERLREAAAGAAVGTIINNIDLRRQGTGGFSELRVYYDRRYQSRHYYVAS
jgi:capsular exopolysaccharide synthesis family protein